MDKKSLHDKKLLFWESGLSSFVKKVKAHWHWKGSQIWTIYIRSYKRAVQNFCTFQVTSRSSYIIAWVTCYISFELFSFTLYYNLCITFPFQIYSVYEEDFGKYTCEAGNKYGKDTQHLELYESSIPICPPLCGDTDLNSAAAAKDMGKIVAFITGTAVFAVFQRLMMI